MPTAIVAYLVLFATVAFGFLFGMLLLGRFLRPSAPTPQKQQPYECGEPAVGSSFVQFDLRFYVMALVFIVFEVEVAFFFPWAVVFGQVTRGLAPNHAADRSAATCDELGLSTAGPPGLPDAGEGTPQADPLLRQLALALMVEMATFFAVLLVGFAYVWRRGDLDWVRAATPPGSPEAQV